MSITAGILAVLQVFWVDQNDIVLWLLQNFVHVFVFILFFVLQGIWEHGKGSLVILWSAAPALAWEGVGILILEVIGLRQPHAVPLTHFFDWVYIQILSSFIKPLLDIFKLKGKNCDESKLFLRLIKSTSHRHHLFYLLNTERRCSRTQISKINGTGATIQ